MALTPARRADRTRCAPSLRSLNHSSA